MNCLNLYNPPQQADRGGQVEPRGDVFLNLYNPPQLADRGAQVKSFKPLTRIKLSGGTFAERALVQVYQAHVADAFAAMLDVSAESSKGPCLYFYCLQGSHANLGHTFTPAHHMILDSTIPFTLIPCPSAASECDAALTPGNPYKCGGIGQQSRAGQDTYDGADTSNNSTSSARSAASMDLPRTNSGRVIEY